MHCWVCENTERRSLLVSMTPDLTCIGATPELMYLYPGWSPASTIAKGRQAEIQASRIIYVDMLWALDTFPLRNQLLLNPLTHCCFSTITHSYHDLLSRVSTTPSAPCLLLPRFWLPRFAIFHFLPSYQCNPALNLSWKTIQSTLSCPQLDLSTLAWYTPATLPCPSAVLSIPQWCYPTYSGTILHSSSVI